MNTYNSFKPAMLAGVLRAGFLTASAAPVIVGTAMAFMWTGTINWGLFVLALVTIMSLHAGANVANDYYDHKSRNDWLNENPTPFSGGSRFIQDGLLLPRTTTIIAFVLLLTGCVLGLLIVILARDLLLLILGVVGLAGGFFYTAPPFKLSYRTLGEPAIAVLFGILPVVGAFVLQSRECNWLIAAWPGLMMSLLIFLVILINEFPDVVPDRRAGKKTFVVRFGAERCKRLYKLLVVVSYIFAAGWLPFMLWPAMLYLLTLPLGIRLIRLANEEELATPGRYRINALTVSFHLIASLALAFGFIAQRCLAGTV